MTEGLNLMESAKTIEQLIHKIDPSLELCDLKCGSLCQDACPFRDEASYMDCHEVEKAVSQVVSQIRKEGRTSLDWDVEEEMPLISVKRVLALLEGASKNES